MKPPGVSIIVCCHNGAPRLRETIRHIASQRLPADVPWEFLLIDNGSSDDSVAVAVDAWQAAGGAEGMLRVVHEPKLGLSHARARAFDEARYEYMVLCDDDNWLSADYAALMFEIMETRAQVGAVGGYGMLVCEEEPPSRLLLQAFPAGPQGAATGPAREMRVFGAGCGIRYSAWRHLQGVGFSSLLTDRWGAALSSGGDYELCLALAILGYEIWYDERLKFIHCIGKERLQWSYFARYARESTVGFHIITSYKMVAGQHPLVSFPWLLMLRNMFVTFSVWLSSELRRRMTGDNHELRLFLRFYALIFGYKMILYAREFRTMVRHHEQILRFRERCRSAHLIRPVLGPHSKRRVRISFFSRPSRPLP